MSGPINHASATYLGRTYDLSPSPISVSADIKAPGSKAGGDLLTKGGVSASNPLSLLLYVNAGSVNIFCTPWGGNCKKVKSVTETAP